MTRISLIHNLPRVAADELAQRGREVGPKQYIPYTALTKGEMKLALLREQAATFAAAYPDVPYYRQAVSMIDNALYQGIANGIHWIGAIPADLQNIAYQITLASRDSRPASGVLLRQGDVRTGVAIGADPIIPVNEENCEEYATREANKFYRVNKKTWEWKLVPVINDAKKRWKNLKAECELKKEIEQIFNQRLESSSHHVLYKSVSDSYSPIKGTDMAIKRYRHVVGVETLGNIAGFGGQLMSDWAEVGVTRTNATGGAGTLGSVQSGFNVAANNEIAYKKYAEWSQNRRPGTKVNGIGDLAVITIIVGLVVKALDAASKFAHELNAKKAAALAASDGFGTSAYSAKQGDLDKGDGGDGTTLTDSGNNNILLYGALAAGAILLLDDK